MVLLTWRRDLQSENGVGCLERPSGPPLAGQTPRRPGPTGQTGPNSGRPVLVTWRRDLPSENTVGFLECPSGPSLAGQTPSGTGPTGRRPHGY